MEKKRYLEICLVLIIISLFLAGCEGIRRPGAKPEDVEEDVHRGIRGLRMEFARNLPPNKMFDTDALTIMVEMENRGASDLTGSKCYLHLAGFDQFIFPNLGTGMDIILHPMALAGYIGLFLTGLNLIPIGQLDGGHVARSLVSEKSHRTITYICAFLMFFINPLLALLVLFMYSQTGHSGPLDDLSTVSLSRKIIAALAVILIILCLPIPSEIFKLIFPMFK